MTYVANDPAGEGGAGVLLCGEQPANSEFDAQVQVLAARLGFSLPTAKAVLGMLRGDVL